MKKCIYKITSHIITPEAQLAIATVIIMTSLVLMISAPMRFVPHMERFAITKNEPFWVLLLSIAALLYAGFSALPAALAYREVKSGNNSS